MSVFRPPDPPAASESLSGGGGGGGCVVMLIKMSFMGFSSVKLKILLLHQLTAQSQLRNH